MSEPLRVVSVGYRGGPVLWVARGEESPEPIQMTNAEAFALLGQIQRAITFPDSAEK